MCLKGLLVISVLVASLVSVTKSQTDLSTCESNCVGVCDRLNHVPSSSCDNLCSHNCNRYRRELSDKKIECLISCEHAGSDANSCHSRCRIKYPMLVAYSQQNAASTLESQEKQGTVEDVGEGCVGFGREYCYKICRLDHKESIKVCMCACCMCKF
jgi:hypothetical protein